LAIDAEKSYVGQAVLEGPAGAQIDLDRDEIRSKTRETGKGLLIPIAAPLLEHLLSQATSDNPRSPVHPRSYAIIHAQNGCVATPSTSSLSCSLTLGCVSLATIRAEA
jgi:hypothetical protein